MPYYRRNLYILSVTIFLASTSWNQVSPFLPLFLKTMGVAKQDLLHWSGWVFAAPAVASIVAMPFWGRMGDRHGQKPMVIRAGFFLACIYFGMSICQTPWQLVILRFLNGALTGFIPGSMALIATNTPEDEAPRYVATAQTSAAAGQIAGPLVGGVLANLFGYRGSMLASGTAVLICTIMVLLLVREPNKVRATGQTNLLQDFAASMRSPVLTSLMVTVLLYGAFVAAINPILVLHVIDMNGGRETWLAGVVLAILPLAFVLSAHRWSRLGERWGYARVIHTGLAGAAVCGMVLSLAHNIWVFAAVFFTAGVFLAAISPSVGAIICTRIEESERGGAYGMQMSANMLGATVSPFLAGYIGAAYGIPSVFVLIGAACLIGVFVFPFLVRRWER